MRYANLTARLYRWIAQAFPETFLRAHGEEMMYASEEVIQETAAREGVGGLLRMAPRLLFDLLHRITVEYAEEIAQDVRYAVRNLRHHKVSAITAVLSLSLGISGVTVLYSQVESTMLRDVPEIRNPEQLVALQGRVSYPDYERFRDASGQFESLAAYMAKVPLMVRIDRNPERVWSHIVTTNYFSTLGTMPARGRLLGDEDTKGAPPSLVISHKFWQEKLGGSPKVIGQIIHVNGQPVTIVGVTAEQFRGASPMLAAADIFLPVGIGPQVAPELRDGILEKRLSAFTLLGRLRSGTTVKQAETVLDTQMQTFQKEANDPAKDQKGRRVTLVPGGKIFPVRKEDLGVLTGMPLALMGLMLWIACANVATMVLAKALERRKEIATRLSLGANRPRLIRQLLTESMLLAVVGGLLGIVWSYWQIGSIDQFKPILPTYMDLQAFISWKALLLTLGASILTGVFAGLTPALEATRTDLTTALKGSGGFPRIKWWGSRNVLVMQQVAASLMLLLITGLVVIGFNRNSGMHVGFDSVHLYRFSLDPIRDGYSNEKTVELVSHLQERLFRVPGVKNVALSTSSPLDLGQNATNLWTKKDSGNRHTHMQSIRLDRIGPGYFATVSVPLIHGHEFTQQHRSSSNVVIVNEQMARQTWPDAEPVGQFAEIEGKPHQVIGVVKNIRSGTILTRTFSSAFVPMTDSDYVKPLTEGLVLLVRGEPGFDVVKAVQQEIHSKDPDLTVFNSASMETDIANSLSFARMATFTYGAIGAYGLLLAAIGLAGVTAQAVARRTREIGIRIALGATAKDVLQLVLREGFLLTVVGAIAGVAGALGIVRLLSGYFSALSDVTQTSLSDPLLILGAPLLLCGLAMAACFWPAARSVRIDPMIAIREE